MSDNMRRMLSRTDKHIAAALRKRWEKVPGVRYPAHSGKTIPRRAEAPVLNPEEWVSTTAVAKRLRVSNSLVLRLLSKQQVRRIYGVDHDNRVALHWERHAVEQIVAAREPSTSVMPAGYMSIEAACGRLALSRASVSRLVQQGAVAAIRASLEGTRGCRPRTLLAVADVEAVRARRGNSPKTRRAARRGRDGAGSEKTRR